MDLMSNALGFGFGVLATLVADFLLYRRKGESEIRLYSAAADQDRIAELSREVEALRKENAQSVEVHAYARKLEAKVQELESAGASGENDVRVQVLERQLAEKADLESRLAIATQQLEDARSKAEMFESLSRSVPAPVVVPPTGTIPSETVSPAPESMELHGAPAIPPTDFVKRQFAKAQAAKSAEAKEVEIVEAPVAKPKANPEASSPDGPAQPDPKQEAPSEAARPEAARPEAARPVAARPEPGADPFVAAFNENRRDQLEKIDGIGPVYQQKLYEAGVRTFAQLAAASPSRITEIIEEQSWQKIDVMKWRREAALYAAGEKE